MAVDNPDRIVAPLDTAYKAICPWVGQAPCQRDTGAAGGWLVADSAAQSPPGVRGQLEKHTEVFGQNDVGVEHNDTPGNFPLPRHLAQHVLSAPRKNVLLGLVV
jgi:hypothetical protein